MELLNNLDTSAVKDLENMTLAEKMNTHTFQIANQLIIPHKKLNIKITKGSFHS